MLLTSTFEITPDRDGVQTIEVLDSLGAKFTVIYCHAMGGDTFSDKVKNAKTLAGCIIDMHLD